MAYTLEQLKGVYIPKNTTVSRNNANDAAHGLNIPNDAISLFNYVLDAITYAGSGSGITNLSLANNTASTIDVNSSSGADVTLPAATNLLAGLQTAAGKTKESFITITQPVNLDNLELDVEDLTTLTGVASNSTNLGIFTGNTIPDNSTIKAALQALETSIGSGFSENGISGTGAPLDKYRLGGTLNQNTIINGAFSKYLIVNDTTSITLEADNNIGTNARTTLYLGSSLIAGGALRSEINNNSNRYAEMRVDPDGTLTSLRQVNGNIKAAISMVSENSITMEQFDGTYNRNLTINNSGHFINNLDTGTTDKVLYIEDITGKLYKGDAPAGGGGSGIVKYSAGNNAYVMATGTGITFSKVVGEGTFNIPSGVILISARIIGRSSDLAANNFTVTFPLTEAADYPSVTKINMILGGPASAGVPHIYDIDNTPQIQCIDSTSHLSIRILNLNGIGTSWALKFNF